MVQGNTCLARNGEKLWNPVSGQFILGLKRLPQTCDGFFWASFENRNFFSLEGISYFEVFRNFSYNIYINLFCIQTFKLKGSH